MIGPTCIVKDFADYVISSVYILVLVKVTVVGNAGGKITGSSVGGQVP